MPSGRYPGGLHLLLAGDPALLPPRMSTREASSRRWDLNCDLGEGEPRGVTSSLFACVGSANVACGGHAGDPASMAGCARFAVQHGVRFGAHPGLAGEFGRGTATLTPRQLATLVEEQVQHLRACLGEVPCRLHHVKLHGSLYHLSDSTAEHAVAYLRAVRRVDPSLRVYARAGGRVVALAAAEGVEAWPEVFLDRGYLPGGGLVPRGQPGDQLSPDATLERLESILQTGAWTAVDGSPLGGPGRTLCLHGDALGVVDMARRVAARLRGERPPGAADCDRPDSSSP